MPETREASSEPARQSAAAWRKSSLSMGNGNCIEVAVMQGAVICVRDSVGTDGPVLRFTSTQWTTFIAGVHGGDLPR